MKEQLLKFKPQTSNMRALAQVFNKLARIGVFALILFMLPVFGLFAQDCKISISVKNNIESVNSEGRIYFMQIENSGNEDLNISLLIKNNNNCINPDETEGSSNVNVNLQLLTEDKQIITEKIVLKSKEVYKFLVKVTIPEGTPINRWNCSEVEALSDACPEIPASLILYTYNPDPQEH